MTLQELLDAHVVFCRTGEHRGPVIFYDPDKGKHYWTKDWRTTEVDLSLLDPDAKYEVLDA